VKQRASIAAILGGLAAVFVLALLVIGPGRHHPSPPSLKDHPNAAILGELLWTDSSGCIVRAAASGASRERVYCPNVPNPIQVGWLDDGSIGYIRYDPNGPTLIRVDPVTKTETDLGAKQGQPNGAFGGHPPLNVHDEYAEVRDGGEVWVGRTGALSRIHTFDVPNSAWPSMMAWSPDGEWMAFQYVNGRSGTAEIWLLSRDGRTAGTLATDARPTPSLSWRIEGVGISPSTIGK
jgi:hypothetical protein